MDDPEDDPTRAVCSPTDSAEASSGPRARGCCAKLDVVDVSVVICTASSERWRDLIEAVESVRAQTGGSAELILVVDHNTELAERARLRWPDVAVVENPLEQGVSNARNAGIEHARGEVIAFLDDDAVASAGWLEALTRSYDSSAVLGVGGRIDPIWACGRPGWFPDEFGWVVGCSYTGLPEHRAPVRNLIGANMSFRREVFEAVGGFDSRIGRRGSLPIGCDETEFCIRAGRRWPGRHVIYEPAAAVGHHVTAKRGSWRYFVSRCYAEGRSKAVVAQLVGSQSALSTELRYATHVLPSGIAAGVRDALVDADEDSVGRAAAIVVGLGCTALGFVAGWIEGACTATR